MTDQEILAIMEKTYDAGWVDGMEGLIESLAGIAEEKGALSAADIRRIGAGLIAGMEEIENGQG